MSFRCTCKWNASWQFQKYKLSYQLSLRSVFWYILNAWMWHASYLKFIWKWVSLQVFCWSLEYASRTRLLINGYFQTVKQSRRNIYVLKCCKKPRWLPDNLHVVSKIGTNNSRRSFVPYSQCYALLIHQSYSSMYSLKIVFKVQNHMHRKTWQ